MNRPDFQELKKQINEIVGEHLGKIINKEQQEFPGIENGLEFHSDLEYQGVIAKLKYIENLQGREEKLSSIRRKGDIEVHFFLFSPGTSKTLKTIWDLIDANFRDVSHFYVEQNEQYGQTGKLIVYFGFDYCLNY